MPNQEQAGVASATPWETVIDEHGLNPDVFIYATITGFPSEPSPIGKAYALKDMAPGEVEANGRLFAASPILADAVRRAVQARNLLADVTACTDHEADLLGQAENLLSFAQPALNAALAGQALPPCAATVALQDLLEQLEAVGIYQPGEDTGQWAGTEGVSFAQAAAATAAQEGL